MTSVLKPAIISLVNGLLTIDVLDPVTVSLVFDQLLIFRASAASGPFTQLDFIPLAGAAEYTYLDATSSPNYYYKAQFYNSGTMVSSVFSELAQETGIFNPYSVPISTATYPAEISLSDNDREIVESIRLAIGDMGSIELDQYISTDPQSAFTCASRISSDKNTWELSEYKGWPQRIILNGTEKISLIDPKVLGYKFLTFSGTGPVITGSLTIWYNHFRFSDHEILMAYDRSVNLMYTCPLPAALVTTEMRIMQAAILLLEGEVRDIQASGAVSIKDGDTSYDNSSIILSRTQDLKNLRDKLAYQIDCARWCNVYNMEGIRLE
jgi:hypothetical protein